MLLTFKRKELEIRGLQPMKDIENGLLKLFEKIKSVNKQKSYKQDLLDHLSINHEDERLLDISFESLTHIWFRYPELIDHSIFRLILDKFEELSDYT